jgi:ubiquinone/menaquinone biosynthesis C-methylase UbiE
LVEEYSSWFGDLRGKMLLDIGCGFGGKSIAYAERGAFVTGVDIDPVHAAGAGRYSRRMGRPMDVVTGDAAALPFSDGSFDLIVANDSMEHFTDPSAALEEFARVARPGGLVLLFFTPWGSPLASHLYDHIHTPWCHLIFSESMLEQLLELSLARRGEADPAGVARMMMNEYRITNNRIDVTGYRRILERISSLETVGERLRPPRFGMLECLTSIPRIGELFTGTVAAALRKKD